MMAFPRQKYSPLHLLFVFLSGLVLLFIVAPLLGMVLKTTPVQLLEVARQQEVRASIWLTLVSSFVSTTLFAVAAIPLSYLLARKRFPFRGAVNALVDLPIVIPHTAAGIAILGFVSRDTLAGKAAGAFGLDFVGHPAGIGLAMAFVSIPFLINAARDGFAGVPERFEKAALNLGASPTRVFFSISLPLAWRNIVSGLVMMFARGMSEFGAVVIIAYHPIIAPVLIYEWFGAFGLQYARPVAVLFMLVSLVFFVALRLLNKKGQHA